MNTYTAVSTLKFKKIFITNPEETLIYYTNYLANRSRRVTCSLTIVLIRNKSTKIKQFLPIFYFIFLVVSICCQKP